MGHQRLISLNAHLASLVRNRDSKGAWLLFKQIQSSGLGFDSYTCTSALVACSILTNAQNGRQVHALIIKTGSSSESVVQTALIDMYSKCGSLVDSIRIFHKVKSKDFVLWNALLSGFVRDGLANFAIRHFLNMRRNEVDFSDYTLCSVLKACTSLHFLQQGRQVHNMVIVRGSDLLILSTALIDFYSKCGYVDDAIRVFCSLNCEKDDVIYNSLISGLIQNERYLEAYSIMSGRSPNEKSLANMATAYAKLSNLQRGRQIHCIAIKRDFNYDVVLSNSLIDMYSKCGEITSARMIFDLIQQKNVVSWTSIIDAYGSHGQGVEALKLFDMMVRAESYVPPNSVTFLAVLSACAHSGLTEEGRNCFILMKESYGIEPAPEHFACFIDLLCRRGQLDEAWNCYIEMISMGVQPNEAVWVTLLNTCMTNSDMIKGEFVAKCLMEIEPQKPANYILLSNFYANIGRWEVVDRIRMLMRKIGMVKEMGNSWIAIDRFN